MARRTTRSRPSRSVRTSTTSVSGKSGGGWAKYILPAAAVSVVAYLLWPKKAHAADLNVTPGPGPGPSPGPGPDPGPGPSPGPTPGPSSFPATATLGKVAVAGFSGLRVYGRPTTSAGVVASLSNGTMFQMTDPLTVVGWANYIAEEGLPFTPENRWAAIRTAGGLTGYLRAIGPAGEANIQVVRQGAPGTGANYDPRTGALLSPYYPHYPHHSQPWAPAWRGW